MNDDDNYIHKYYAPFLSSNNYEDVFLGTEHDSEKWMVCRQKNAILDLLLKKSKSFEWHISFWFFSLNNKKLSQHMDQISEHIKSSNPRKYSYDQMRKMFVNLGSKKGRKMTTPLVN